MALSNTGHWKINISTLNSKVIHRPHLLLSFSISHLKKPHNLELVRLISTWHVWNFTLLLYWWFPSSFLLTLCRFSVPEASPYPASPSPKVTHSAPAHGAPGSSPVAFSSFSCPSSVATTPNQCSQCGPCRGGQWGFPLPGPEGSSLLLLPPSLHRHVQPQLPCRKTRAIPPNFRLV